MHRLVEREARATQARGEALPVEVLHDEVDDVGADIVLHLPEVDDVDDVLVADVVDGLRFVKEAGDNVFLRRELLEQHLHGDALADERVLAEIHGAHATLAELGLDDVVADLLADERHREPISLPRLDRGDTTP